jgi:hypothetical protein
MLALVRLVAASTGAAFSAVLRAQALRSKPPRSVVPREGDHR